MPGITLRNGLISYYGNPAGYIDKEKAVVDTIFQSDELVSWLQSRSLTPRWVEGVMERLLAGERLGGIESAVPLKSVRIWQLRPDVDVYKKFIPYAEMVQRFGEPIPEEYRVSYDGQLDTNDLEGIYTRCNTNHPTGYAGHSLSMSDIIELYDEDGSEFHYCDRFGFKKVNFKPLDQNQAMDMRM